MSHVKNRRNPVLGLAGERVENRTLLSASLGDVNVSLVGQTLTITGDTQNDHVVVSETGGGEIKIHGSPSTNVTASAGLSVVNNTIVVPAGDIVNTINANFGDSSNNIAFLNMTLPQTLNVSAGNGSDQLLMVGDTGGSNVTVSMGTGADHMTIYRSTLGSLTSTMGTAASTNLDRIQVRGSQVSGQTSITTGGGADQVMLASAPHNGGDNFGGDVNVSLGAGDDYFSANESTFLGNLNVDVGTGNNIAVGVVSVAGTINVTGTGVNLIHR